MKNYKIASTLILIHGALMEIGFCLFAIFVIIFGNRKIDISKGFSFIVPYFKENLILMSIIGIVFGTVRVIGGIGLWKNKMWGLVLSLINCITTMILMIFMLPAGIVDGILACSAMIIILIQYFGDKKIIENY